jgi:hypothetical protein
MDRPGITLGHHGCDQKVGEGILSPHRRHVEISTNDYDWLGSGAYFWEDDPERALQWAEMVQANPQHFGQKISKPFVLGAIIDLGLCLDLTKTACLDEIRAAHHHMMQLLEHAGSAVPKNKPGFKGDVDLVKRHLDCATVNYVHQLRADQGLPAYDTVRGPFTEGRPLYEGAKIMDRTHIQICVRNPRVSIRGYFRPL